MLTAFGAAAVTFMMLTYALERRGRGFIFAFGCGCLLSSAYGFAAARGRSAWWSRFGPVEFNRWRKAPSAEERARPAGRVAES